MKIPFRNTTFTANQLRKLHSRLAVFWLCLSVPNFIWWSNSVAWVSWMSLYAIVVSHWAAQQAARAEENSPDV